MKTVKEWMLFLVVSLVSMVVVSCSDDDDEPKMENTSFYIEVKDIKGGGLSDTEIASLKTTLNQYLKSEKLQGNESIVKQQFLMVINNLQKELKGKFPNPEENLEVVFHLLNEEGDSVAEGTVFIMKTIEGK